MKHKYADLIKAWADGAEIEQACRNGIGEILWYPFKGDWQEHYEYRIKSEPKEPQYLYVYNHTTDAKTCLSTTLVPETYYNWKYMGKVRIEK